MKSISFNRGEWSELYGALYLLVYPNIELVDSDLEFINDSTFKVKKLYLNTVAGGIPTEITYSIVHDSVIIEIQDNDDEAIYLSIQDIKKYKNELLDKILHHANGSGSFKVGSIDKFLDKFSQGYVLKSNTQHKSDFSLLNIDNIAKKDIRLSYSVKSSLGSPATILNASNHTNFEYKIENCDYEIMDKINGINTRRKLRDRIRALYDFECDISFHKVLSETFEYNLEMVDTSMPFYLANSLLYFYLNDHKNLSDIFFEANDFRDRLFSDKKLANFLLSASFGFFPAKSWDGTYSVNGGFILVLNNGNVCCIDMVYYLEEVYKYLLKESKLDSPSSTRYHMLEIYERDGEFFFTLNLQVRFK